jgi:hypothetical protein
MFSNAKEMLNNNANTVFLRSQWKYRRPTLFCFVFSENEKEREQVEMSLTVDFINILRAHFSYESAWHSFSLVTF